MEYWCAVFKLDGQPVISILGDNDKMVKPLTIFNSYFMTSLSDTDVSIGTIAITHEGDIINLEDYFDLEPETAIFDISEIRKYEIYNVIKDDNQDDIHINISELRERTKDDLEDLMPHFLSGDLPKILKQLILQTKNI